jgi:outer membrane protein assembly factor BamB
VAEAQSGGLRGPRITPEASLNRAGLTRSWWGQAVTNAQRDRLLYMTSDDTSVYLQTSSGLITAFDTETGRRRWGTQVGQSDRPTYPLSINGTNLLIVNGMDLSSIDSISGNVLWSFNLPGQPASSPSGLGGMIYVGFLDGSLFAFDGDLIQKLADKQLLPSWGYRSVAWRYKTSAAIASPAMVTQKYVAFASENGTLYSVTKRDRELLFQFETDARLTAPPVLYNESLLVASEDFKVYSIGLRNGRYNWQFSAGGPITVPPLVVGNEAFVTPVNAGLISLNADNGRVKWTRPNVQRVLSVSPERVYVYDSLTNLIALDRRTGAVVSSVRLEPFQFFVANDRSDRIFVSTESGLVMCLQEIGRDFPLLHRSPDRQPVLPELVPEDEASAAVAPTAEGEMGAMPAEGEMPADEPAN